MDFSEDNLKPVGGTIFYEDLMVGGTYVLYDKDKNKTTNKSKATYYEVLIPGSGDRFYVVDLNLEGPFRWTRQDQKVGVEGTSIGIGRYNTNTILATEDQSKYKDHSLWDALVDRNNKCINGCNDWYIGSKDEVDEVLKSGVAKKWFETKKGKKRDKILLWSSSERNHPSLAWYWDEKISKWYRQVKEWGCSACFIRSF